MWLISLRDLQWRRRRFAIAVLVAGLAFALTLVMDGLLEHIRLESVRTVQLFDADGWVVSHGASGPFTTTKLLPQATTATVAHAAGVKDASPLLMLRSTVGKVDVNMVGYEPGGMTEPTRVVHGRVATAPNEAMVDKTLGIGAGKTVTFAGHTYPVVGVLKDTSFYFGTPTVFLPIATAQKALVAGQPLASTIVTRGRPTSLGSGFDVMTNDQVRADLDRTLEKSTQTLDMINGLLWLVAAGIIGSIIYMSALERVRDFAVLKATGASSSRLMAGLGLQALILAVLSGIVASILAMLLAPLFPFPAEIPTSGYLTLLAVSLVVGLLASLAGLRRVAHIDPALAFGGG